MAKQQMITVADLGRVVTGKTPPTAKQHLYGDGYPFITPTDIGNLRYCEPTRQLSEQGRESQRNLLLPAKAVCVTCIASVGKMCMTDRPSFTNQQINSVIVDESRYDPFFVFYLLQTQVDHLKAIASGSATPIINKTAFSEIEVRVPPLPIQRRIAGILSAYDELIENSQRRIKILESMARALYREWFVHFRFPGHEAVPLIPSPLGSIPQGWEVRKLPECVHINPRVTVPREGEKAFVPMGCLSNDSMIISDIESRAGNSGAKFQNGDTLFARITPCLENGKTGFVQFLPSADHVAFGSTEFIVLRSGTLTPEFVYCLARSDEFRGVAIKSMSGATGRQRVQEQCFTDFAIAQPPRTLLERFSVIVGPIFRFIFELDLQTQTLRRTRDLLLPRLLSGQIDVEAMPS